MISTASRARRCLVGLERYHSQSTSDLALPPDLPLEPQEAVIGVYLNNPPTFGGALVIVESGLLVEDGGRWRRVPFRSMVRALFPEGKVDIRHLDLALSDGSVVRLRIEGGTGRFLDVFSFVRFFDRVLADRRAASGIDPNEGRP
jgi:hypothetical protein